MTSIGEKEATMSLQYAKKLQDLKEQANAVLVPRNAALNEQRPRALRLFLNDMANYLEEQAFVLEATGDPLNGFKATYKGLELKVQELQNQPTLDNSDYAIQLNLPRKSLVVYLRVNPGTYVEPVEGATTQKLIDDYENRVIPSLEALSDSELDGKYELFYQHENQSGTRIEILSDGKEVVDKIFENY